VSVMEKRIVSAITSAPWARKMPSRSPAMPEGGRSERPEAGSRPPQGTGIAGHFGGRCCFTAGSTTDHSPDASRLRYPGTGTSNKVQ
jgi:hypothetical protein